MKPTAPGAAKAAPANQAPPKPTPAEAAAHRRAKRTCRYCGAVLASRDGRDHHERQKHGRVWQP